MTDLNKIKACARAMEIEINELAGRLYVDSELGKWSDQYNPLRYSDQADALEGWLLERGWIHIRREVFEFTKAPYKSWTEPFRYGADMTVAENRRRARVECVAKMEGQE